MKLKHKISNSHTKFHHLGTLFAKIILNVTLPFFQRPQHISFSLDPTVGYSCRGLI